MGAPSSYHRATKREAIKKALIIRVPNSGIPEGALPLVAPSRILLSDGSLQFAQSNARARHAFGP